MILAGQSSTAVLLILILLYPFTVATLGNNQNTDTLKLVNRVIINFNDLFQTCLDQNRKTAYDLISSHGDVENLIFFAMFMQGTSF